MGGSDLVGGQIGNRDREIGNCEPSEGSYATSEILLNFDTFFILE